MSPRYVVRPCDNDGTVEGLKRDRTWSVVDLSIADDHVVADLDARTAARRHAAEWNAVDGMIHALAWFATHRRCDWQTGYGLPWTETCGAPAAPDSPCCTEHIQDLKDNYPHSTVPVLGWAWLKEYPNGHQATSERQRLATADVDGLYRIRQAAPTAWLVEQYTRVDNLPRRGAWESAADAHRRKHGTPQTSSSGERRP
jgi:hypothetical protein